MRLFTIGASVSQGFMSAAAARTDLSYSTLIARKMGLVPGQNYLYPTWEKGGHPVNLERLLRKLNRLYGSDIFGPVEWPLAAITIANFLDDVEDYYERGAGDEHTPYPGNVGYFHNVAVRGFDVADAWLVTPELCHQQIALDNARGGARDNTFATPNASFYRTALHVLNPSRDNKYDEFSALQWLEEHATNKTGEGGVENLILWLGSNNALGTILDLEIVETPNDPALSPVDMLQPERVKFNLWHPNDFAKEYEQLLDRVDAIMQQNVDKNWKVFIGTVPAVTIAPLAKGVGEHLNMPDPFGHLGSEARYYKYYTYFIFEEEFARTSDVKLTRQQAYYIDTVISEYNRIIDKLVQAKNTRHKKSGGPQRYFIVDIGRTLLELAYKRNNEHPTYQFPPYFNRINPKPNTKYYHATPKGKIEQGGIFSLDGVHPSAIGHGLLAHEFANAMSAAGVNLPQPLDWPAIFTSDSLWQRPIRLMREIYQHEDLAEIVVRLMRRMSRNEN